MDARYAYAFGMLKAGIEYVSDQVPRGWMTPQEAVNYLADLLARAEKKVNEEENFCGK